MNNGNSPLESYSTQIASVEGASPASHASPGGAPPGSDGGANEVEGSDTESASGSGLGLSDGSGAASVDELHDEHADSDDEAWVLRHLFRGLHALSPSPHAPSVSTATPPRGGAPDQKGERRADRVGGDESSAQDGVELPAERVNCPQCFATLSLQCQRHERYDGQFRAIFVRNCIVDRELTASVSGGAYTQGGGLVDVRCAECGTRVGVRERNGVYHFCNVMY